MLSVRVDVFVWEELCLLLALELIVWISHADGGVGNLVHGIAVQQRLFMEVMDIHVPTAHQFREILAPNHCKGIAICGRENEIKLNANTISNVCCVV